MSRLKKVAGAFNTEFHSGDAVREGR
jgi:hypothetical protein